MKPAIERKQEGGAARRADIDRLRGLVMALMAVDHVRMYLSAARIDPLDLEATTPGMFMTRWITHLCAPIFVLLVGVGAGLSVERGRSISASAGFLMKRGLWIIALEFTWMHLAWVGRPALHFTAQVLWAIGVGMLVLGLLMRLGPWACALIGAVVVAGHDALPAFEIDPGAPSGWLLAALHEPMIALEIGPLVIYPLYSLLPWIGVPLLGYALGVALARGLRGSTLVGLGVGACLIFAALRFGVGYGDPAPPGPGWMGALNVSKYPASLQFLLLTLGLGLVWLGLDAWRTAQRPEAASGGLLVTLGREPLIFYLLHIPLIHLGTRIFGWMGWGDQALNWWLPGRGGVPEDFGLDPGALWLVSALVVLALWPICGAWGRWKARRHWPVLRYL